MNYVSPYTVYIIPCLTITLTSLFCLMTFLPFDDFYANHFTMKQIKATVIFLIVSALTSIVVLASVLVYRDDDITAHKDVQIKYQIERFKLVNVSPGFEIYVTLVSESGFTINNLYVGRTCANTDNHIGSIYNIPIYTMRTWDGKEYKTYYEKKAREALC